MRQIIVCPGIGDNLWLLQKLVNQKEKFDFLISGSKPQRGKQIFDLTPQVTNVAKYVQPIKYQVIEKLNIQNAFKNWKDITHPKVYLSANAHLEEGKRIEDFLPDLETSYTIDYNLSAYNSPLDPKKKYIGIYCSAYSTLRAWGFWDERGWLELIKSIHAENKGYEFVIIGAQWDIDIATSLMKLLKMNKIPHFNMIGHNLGTVAVAMKQLHYAFYFPSGLGILSETLGCPTFMFYPPHLEKMINAWADPERIKSGDYKGQLFCTPQTAFKWAKDNGKI